MLLSVPFRITSSTEEFDQYPHLKINYSNFLFASALQILPNGLLFQKGINQNKPELVSIRNLHRLFQTNYSPQDNILEYDLFSMTFFFISRYEEWQNFKKDEHDRFAAKQSILNKYDTLHRPIVDLCVFELKEKLKILFPNINWPEKKAGLISTIDVDNLYAFKGRPIWRTIGAGLKDLLKRDIQNFKTRIKVLSKKQNDPFDIYYEVAAFCKKESLPLIFFFLYRNATKYDRGLKPGSTSFLEVFKKLKKFSLFFGIHPSYYSSTEKTIIASELFQLEKDLGQKVIFSRQHYLRFDIKTTPRLLINAGIEVDFSMGFSDTVGFRAGTCFPFYYFDFENEKQENLLLMPFCLMDGAYSIHHKKDKNAILKEVTDIAKDIKKCGGNMITVFHERSFYNHLYPGFGTLYKELHLQTKDLFNT